MTLQPRVLDNGLCAVEHKPLNVVYTFMLYMFCSILIFQKLSFFDTT